MTETEHLSRYQFATQLVAGKQVADIACGTGYGTQLLAKAGALSVHGMDVSEDAVAICRERYAAANVTYTVADAQRLSAVPDGQFDIVVSFETIEHLPDVESYLDEIRRVLRPGGMFLVSTPDRRIGSVLHRFLGPQNPFHVREYTERELLTLLSTRFQISSCFGQAFVTRWVVLWPVQILVKAACRAINTAKVYQFRDDLYSNGGNVEVVPRTSKFSIPKFWVIACIRPEE